MKNILKNLTLIVSCALVATVVSYNVNRQPVHAQAATSSVWAFPAVPLLNCAWPGAVVAPPPAGEIAYCSTTQGLAQAIAPSTTFTLIGGTSAAFTGTSPIVVSGSSISCPTCATGSVVTSLNGSTGAVTISLPPALAATTDAVVNGYTPGSGSTPGTWSTQKAIQAVTLTTQ